MIAFRFSWRWTVAVLLAALAPVLIAIGGAAGVAYYRDERDVRIDYLRTQVRQADADLVRLKTLMRERAALNVHAELINAYANSAAQLTQRVAALGGLPPGVRLGAYTWGPQSGTVKGWVDEPLVADTLATRLAGPEVPHVSLRLGAVAEGTAPFTVSWKTDAN